jgi:hypothetical protein
MCFEGLKWSGMRVLIRKIAGTLRTKTRKLLHRQAWVMHKLEILLDCSKTKQKKDGEASCLHDSKQIGALEVRAAVGKVAESPSFFFLESAIRGIYGVYGTEVE